MGTSEPCCHILTIIAMKIFVYSNNYDKIKEINKKVGVNGNAMY